MRAVQTTDGTPFGTYEVLETDNRSDCPSTPRCSRSTDVDQPLEREFRFLSPAPSPVAPCIRRNPLARNPIPWSRALGNADERAQIERKSPHPLLECVFAGTCC